jgi:hypothetical protein
MMGISDTSADAERVLINVYRRMSPADKLQRLSELRRLAKRLHATGVLLRKPAATPLEIQDDWLVITLGHELAAQVKGRASMPAEDEMGVILDVAGRLSQMAIPYAVSGSTASAIYGKPRLTNDVDIMVEPFPGKEAALCTVFSPDYYSSLPAVHEAVRQRSSFNLIHQSIGFKVDMFLRKDRPFDQSVMARRRPQPIADRPGQSLDLVSAEDLILLKLEWYRLGNAVSEHQWGDVIGVIRAQADRLDQAYLGKWAADLGVADLLARAREDAQIK